MEIKHFPHYLSVLIERVLELEDSSIFRGKSQYVWLDYLQAGESYKNYTMSARQYLNPADTFISFLFGNHFIQEPVLNNVMIWDCEDRPVLRVARHSFEGDMGLLLNNEVMLPDKLKNLLEEFKSQRSLYSSFGEVMRFRLLFAREKDKLKKFFYGFWALEIFINKICGQATSYTKRVLEERIEERNRHDLFIVPKLVKTFDPKQGDIAQRFEVMQRALLGTVVQEDISSFKKIAEKRNKIAHGKDDDLPINNIENLLDKYLKLACHFGDN